MVTCSPGIEDQVSPNRGGLVMNVLSTVMKSVKSSFSFQGKEPSDQHIKQVCMRVMQGKN